MRLIDADALLDEICDLIHKYENVNFGYRVIMAIHNTPTIEPSGDLISILIGAIEKCGEEKIYPQALIETIKALPSAEPIPNNFCKSQLITCSRVNECNGVCPFEEALSRKARQKDIR